MVGDDHTFSVNFSTEGVSKLRELVNEKLKEFMGDYTDDTLVDYVIVLLKNGRRKDEAKNELNVFLGDDSDSFVSWLWDHLVSSISLYVEAQEPHSNVPKKKSATGGQIVRTDSHEIEFEGEKRSSTIRLGNSHGGKQEGSGRDGNENKVPNIRSIIATNLNAQNEPNRRTRRARRSISPRPIIEKRRRRAEDRELSKRDDSQTTITAPRRLLQFAVRDAVAPSRPSISVPEPLIQRLRSVVSTPKVDPPLEERPKRIRPTSGLRSAMSAAVKSVAEIRPPGTIFNRLGPPKPDVPNFQEEHRGGGVGVILSFHDDTMMSTEYQEVREVSEMDDHKLVQYMETDNPIVAVNGNAKSDVGPQMESQKTETPTGLHSTGPPMEDADSRTIFVSNVHFAATKDSLSRHFNKFGDVLKVIILTDPSTGQPKGSAYIVFMRKEASENALSLDGTSFMSRSLKIVTKSSAQPESASLTTRPRIASPFIAPRFVRAPFGRGNPNLYRARVPIKPGARSYQWKRDSQSIGTDPSGQASNSTVPTLTRSLTYVRTEVKANGTSGSA